MNESKAETFTGRFIDLSNPSPEDICIEDIAHALSGQARFNAHCTPTYTVADHSLACCKYAKDRNMSLETQLGLLLHDAAEAYTGDIISPLKRLLAPLFKPIEARLEDDIWFTLCRGILKPDQDAIKKIDDLMLVTEAFWLMPSRKIMGVDTDPDVGIAIEPLMPALAALEFMVQYHILIKAIKDANG